MSTHAEKTLDSDGRKGQGGRQKERQDLYGKSTQIGLWGHLWNTNCRFCHTAIYTNICTKVCHFDLTQLQPEVMLLVEC